MTFKAALEKKVKDSLYNDFGRENFDTVRFNESNYIETSHYSKLKNFIKKMLRYNQKALVDYNVNRIEKHIDGFEKLWSLLDDESKKLLISVVSYKLLGCKKVVISGQGRDYLNLVNTVNLEKASDKRIRSNFLSTDLEHFDLSKIGYDVKIFFLAGGIVVDFIIEQYSYQTNFGQTISASKGDTVLDLGGCWGDTSLYFAAKVGTNGRVYSFEFIPRNIEIFKINVKENPHYEKVISLVEYPVSDKSNIPVYFKDNGPASDISLQEFEGFTGTTRTISIDDFVKDSNLNKVDFIKMDIEGAELNALKGAANTIKKFRPKLAIAVYHNFPIDMVTIPEFINNLDLGYKFYFAHFTIHGEESMLFCEPG